MKGPDTNKIEELFDSIAGDVKHMHGVWTREGRSMDPLLPLLVISTFAFAVLAGIGLICGG